MTTSTKIILGVVGAAAAGAVIGLLLAPEKGADLRDRLSNKAYDWADQLGDLIDNGKSKLDELKANVNAAVRNAEDSYV